MGLKTYQHIKIEPFNIKQIFKMTVTKVPNQHTKFYIDGILKDEMKIGYVEALTANKKVKVSIINEIMNELTGEVETKEQVIFNGIIESIKVNTILNNYHINIRAISLSYILDIEKIRCTYQKLDMAYLELMNQAVLKYHDNEKQHSPQALIMDKTQNEEKIEHFIIQYNETSWEFLKRMASRFNVPLIVEDISDELVIYIGTPDKENIGNLTDFVYNIKKDTNLYRKTIENYNEQSFESDFIYYEIISDKIFEIGNRVTFKNMPLYVNEVHICIKDGILKNRYKMTLKSGFHVNKIKNNNIIGLSLDATVIETESDDVKVMFDIDIESKNVQQEYCKFKYSTFYTSDNGGGFYCMPEIGEKVRIYFPDNNDENAFAQSGIRTNFEIGGERGNPDIKYFRTKDGKEIMFSPSGVLIRCVDNEIFINLDSNDGIFIQSSKPINMVANNGAGINISSEGKIVIAAENEIDVFCNGSRLNMKDGITKLRGSSISQN